MGSDPETFPGPADGPADSTFPSQLGEYRLLGELGQGGMGRVYRAWQPKLDRVVALKVLPKPLLTDPRAVARFEREIKAVGRLNHPNIVQAYDAREIRGMTVLVMECVDGIDLAELVRRCGPLRVVDACELVRQAALGLHHAHEHVLVHRDVKPSNLMLGVEGRVKILDLGLALLRQDQPPGQEMTTAGQPMGTFDYMAPEQASDSHQVDPRADVYSLGCTLFKLLTGHAPFSGPQFAGYHQKMAAHLYTPPPTVKQFRNTAPFRLIAVLERMLAKSPDDRFATAADVAGALERLCRGCDPTALLKRSRQALAVPPEPDEAPGRTSAHRMPPSPRVRSPWRPPAARRELTARFGLGKLGCSFGVVMGTLLVAVAGVATMSMFSRPASLRDVAMAPPGDELFLPPEPSVTVFYLSCGEEDEGPGTIYKVDWQGEVLDDVQLTHTATGLALHRRQGLIAAVPCDGGRIERIDRIGRRSTILDRAAAVTRPADVALAADSDTVLLVDNLAGVLARTTVTGLKPEIRRGFEGEGQATRFMSVALTADRHVIVGTDGPPGIYRFPLDGPPENADPFLPHPGGVAADPASTRWAAAQHSDKIHLFDANEPTGSLTVPEGMILCRRGLISFGPPGLLVVVAEEIAPPGGVWLVALETETGHARRLFPWQAEPIRDFVVLPAQPVNHPSVQDGSD